MRPYNISLCDDNNITMTGQFITDHSIGRHGHLKLFLIIFNVLFEYGCSGNLYHSDSSMVEISSSTIEIVCSSLDKECA